MTLRSQKASKTKTGGSPFGQDNTAPPSSELFNSKPHEGDEDTIGGVQDSDEDMCDYDEESEDDEGSLYVPSDVESDFDMEEPNKHEKLVELPLPKSCKFLLLLPREIRDKIYGYVLRLDTPMADHRLRLRCMFCPDLTTTPNKPPLQSEVYEARNLLRTCHQIRDEGKHVFYEVNCWSLYRARLRKTPVHSSTNVHDTQMLFDQLRQVDAIQHFRHVSMRTTISPLAYCDFPLPDGVVLGDPISIHLFELSQHPSILAFHKLDETAQCELFRISFEKFVENRMQVFPNLRSVNLEVSLHQKKIILPGAPNSPLNRCGITLYVRIKLGCGKPATPSSNQASLPVLASYDATRKIHLLSSANVEAHNRSLHPGMIMPFQTDPSLEAVRSLETTPSLEAVRSLETGPFLDPKRQMLSPLRQLLDVQSVEVERLWTICYRQQVIEDGSVIIRKQPLRQLWRFRTVDEMLYRAGPGFARFLDPALEYLKAPSSDVIEIIENTTEDIGHELIA